MPRIGKLILAYFFVFRYIWECNKQNFCPDFLVVLRNLTPTALVAAFRWGIKKTPQKPQKVICLANYPFCGLLGVLGVFVLYLKNHVGVIFKRFGEGGRNKRRQLPKS